MATYFSNNMPAIQAADNLQTLYLMNPGFVGYPDSPAQGNILMFGQHAGNQLPGNEQQFISIPMMAQPPDMGSHPGELSSGITAASNLRQHSLWRDHIPSEFSFVQSINQTSPTNTSSSGNQHHIPGVPTDSSQQSVGEAPSQVGLRREQQGGLSLSLSSSPVQLMASTNSFRSDAPTAAVLPSLAVGSGGEGTGEERTVKWEGGLQSVLMGSKYLKAAQQLLDEVVNVGRVMKSQEDAKSKAKDGKAKKESTAEDTGDVGSNQGNEFSAAERQELQMKKAKLIAMLEEVEQRYKQYRHQMQVVVSSFEAAAGAGAARAYTALALQTISKQFRCLREAISGQIRLSNRSLGEEDGSGGGGKVDGSRLRYIDHQLRQQKALQQLGMVQNNAWRPQRGLPERSVSVLRAWLFEHFLHPYPKDADKVMLAKQTGLTRSQVSNWFINARVRLWKPMVEEMYKEEVKEQENEGRSEEKPSESAEANEDSAAMKPAVTRSPHSATQAINKNTNNQNEEATEKRTSPPSLSTATTAMSSIGNLKSLTGFGLIMSPSSSDHAPSILDNDSLSQFTPKKMRNNGFHNLNPVPTVNTNTNISGEAPNAGGFGNRQGYNLAAAVAAAAAAASENGGSYDSYQIGDIGRYSHESFAPRGNGVSLTLGLPHCDSLSLSGSQHAFLSSPRMVMGRRHDLGSEASNGFCSQNPSAAAAAAGHPGNDYDGITMQGRKRFAAQLLPDFVS